MRQTYLILGGGYTGQRVVKTLLTRGAEVLVTSRSPERLTGLVREGARFLRVDADDPATLENLSRAVPDDVRVLHSVPALQQGDDLVDPTPRLLAALEDRPRRVVYLSTTGVYGDTTEVDHTTPPAPATRRQIVRREAEEAVLAGNWSSLILRPAAIYGPGRGVHVNLRAGRYRLVGEGRNIVSRIHVEDLAALAAAALDSDIEGAYPVADDEPSEAREMATFCAELLGLPPPQSTSADGVPETLRVTRRVNGREVRRLLGVQIRYPSFRVGVPAALAGESE